MKTIFYFTDPHLDEPSPGKHGADAHKNWNEILTELTMQDPDQLVVGGDIGAFSAYPEFFKTVSAFPKLRVTPGNHDTSAQVRNFFPDALPNETDFYLDEEDDDLKWLFLDSSTDKIGVEQLEWLKNQLATTQKEVILFIHHPILPVETPVDKKYPLQNRDIVKDLLLRHQQKVTIFCGHYHTEDHVTEANLVQYVCPATSYQIKKGTSEIEGDSDYFGYRMIYVDGNKIETEVILLYADDF